MAEFKPFRTLTVFQCQKDSLLATITADKLEQWLNAIPFKHVEVGTIRSGWDFPHPAYQTRVAAQGQNFMFRLATEQKKISISQRDSLIMEREEKWREQNPGKNVERDLHNDFKNQVEAELLRNNFILHTTMCEGWFNVAEGFLIINSASENAVNSFIDLLGKAASLEERENVELLLDPVVPNEEVSFTLKRWITNPENVPYGFDIGRSLSLSGGEKNDTVGCEIGYKQFKLEKDKHAPDYLKEGYSVRTLSLLYDSNDDFSAPTDSADDVEVEGAEAPTDDSPVENSLNASFKVTSKGTITDFSLGKCYKAFLRGSEHDKKNQAACFDAEMFAYTTMALPVYQEIMKVFGGFHAEPKNTESID